MEEKLHSDIFNTNSDLCTQREENNKTKIVQNNNNPMSSIAKSSLNEDHYLSDVSNPFETALDSLPQLSAKTNHKPADDMPKKAFTNLDMDNLNRTFDKLEVVQSAGRTDFRQNNEDPMSLSGQDMPEMDSMKGDLVDDDEDNQFQSAELFQDSAAYDFLLNIGNSNKNARDFSKESLFVKFDPLVGKQTLPTGRRPGIENKTQAVPTISENADNDLTSQEESSNVGSTSMSDNNNDKELSTSKEVLKTPVRNSAIEVLDRLISLTPKTPENIPSPEPVKEAPKVDAEKMQYIEELKQLRQFITKQEQEFDQLQKQLEEEKTRNEQLSNKEQALVKRIAEKTKMEQQMGVVMSEYEKNIAQLISDRELEKQKLEEQVKQLTSERDVAMQHLSSVESAFSDVHQKYERCKVVIEQFKTNEETLKADNASLRDIVKQQDNRYDTLKAHAISQLDKANADLEALKKKQEMEVVKCTALLKKADLKTISLQEALTQKQKENEELMAICDGLIQKVG